MDGIISVLQVTKQIRRGDQGSLRAYMGLLSWNSTLRWPDAKVHDLPTLPRPALPLRAGHVLVDVP